MRTARNKYALAMVAMQEWAEEVGSYEAQHMSAPLSTCYSWCKKKAKKLEDKRKDK